MAGDHASRLFSAEIDPICGTIDGWLMPDDTVKLRILDGPALAAATTSPSTQP